MSTYMYLALAYAAGPRVHQGTRSPLLHSGRLGPARNLQNPKATSNQKRPQGRKDLGSPS
jgi:hypothetical protein